MIKPSKKTSIKNNVSDLTEKDFVEYELTSFSPNEKTLGVSAEVRMVLHEPLMTLNAYFTFEAFKQAVLTGNDQIFFCHDEGIQPLQAMEFVRYSAEQMGVQLTANISDQSAIITLSNGAELRFFHVESAFCLGTVGDLYIGGFHYLSEEQQNHTENARKLALRSGHRVTCFSSSQDPLKTVAAWERSLSVDKLFTRHIPITNPTFFFGFGNYETNCEWPVTYFYLTSASDE